MSQQPKTNTDVEHLSKLGRTLNLSYSDTGCGVSSSYTKYKRILPKSEGFQRIT